MPRSCPGALLAAAFSLSLLPAASFGAPQAPAPPADTVPATPAVVNPEDAVSRPDAVPVAATEGGEVRAMWVVRDSMVSRAKIRNAVALAKKYHFNTLFVQVRGRGDAFYDSTFEPRSEELADAPGDFDPLAVAIEEGHKAGLEVHAWMNTFLVWHKKRLPYSSRHVLRQHPEWIVRDKQGRMVLTEQNDCEGAFLNPALPEAREHVKRVFLDVVTRYDVDGVHFDYVRFPSERFSFGARDLQLFREWMLPQISENEAAYADAKARKNRLAWHYLYPKQWKEWRKANVTETVRGVAEAAHALKPGIVVSAAVFPNYSVASQDKGQAWHDWLAADLLDAACPMSYNASTKLVAAQIKDAVKHSHGKPIIAGVGAWQIPAASAIAKGKAYRQIGAAGINFFSYDGMTREGRTERYLDKVGRSLFPSRGGRPNWRRGAATRRYLPQQGGDGS